MPKTSREFSPEFKREAVALGWQWPTADAGGERGGHVALLVVSPVVV